jgi:hypothetical protein
MVEPGLADFLLTSNDSEALEVQMPISTQLRLCFVAGALASISSGCATIKAQNCTENGGYEKGMNDAKAGREMSMTQFTIVCSAADAEAAQRGYCQGYEAGQSRDSGPQLNVSFEGGKLGLVGAHNCSVESGDQVYSARASTESEARQAVMKKCGDAKATCSERSIRCSKN